MGFWGILFNVLKIGSKGLNPAMLVMSVGTTLASYVIYKAIEPSNEYDTSSYGYGSTYSSKSNKSSSKPKKTEKEQPSEQQKRNTKVPDRQKYEHSSSRGEWWFDPDKDFKVEKYLPFSTELSEAYRKALEAINKFLKKRKISPLRENDFKTTVYDTVLYKNDKGKVKTALFPVEMEAKVHRYGHHGEILETYTVKIDLDNPEVTEDLQGPQGPHVGYEVTGHYRKENPSTTGHVLLNRNDQLPDRNRGFSARRLFSRYQYMYSFCDLITPERLFSPIGGHNTRLERIDLKNVDFDGTVKNKNKINGSHLPKKDDLY